MLTSEILDKLLVDETKLFYIALRNSSRYLCLFWRRQLINKRNRIERCLLLEAGYSYHSYPPYNDRAVQCIMHVAQQFSFLLPSNNI